MCGIVSCISTEEINRGVIEGMTSALAHRGPDAFGVHIHPSGRMALGHTRLSIIDLSPAANQPFFSSNGRFAVVFNGEIYNYRVVREELKNKHDIVFKTDSDSEVIVEGFSVWGVGMVEKLDGMFAMVILDQVEQKMFIFRDRVGKKPLFYYQSSSLFLAASEIKSLLKHPALQKNPINLQAIGNFLHLGYIHAPDTIYRDIHKFPAGHVAEVSTRSLTLVAKPFWTVNQTLSSPRITNYDDARKHLIDLLKQSVTKRLISDVPLGSFLSGGIDSSLVTAVAAEFSEKPLKTFNIGFQEDQFDESAFARQVASHLKTDHREYLLQEKEAIDFVEKYLEHFDEPFADTSAIPTMMISQLARLEVKVALTGDGGDELFQGYGAYQWADRLDSTSWKMMRPPLRMVLNATGKSRLQRIGRLLEPIGIGGIRSHIFSQEQYFFSQQEIKQKVLRDAERFRPFEYAAAIEGEIGLTPGERQALFDFRFYLADDLLVKVDRASMYYGLECRSPLLDHHLVDYSLRLDASFKKRRGVSKFILKDILSGYLPARLIKRPKQGFSIPLSKWMKGELRYMIETYLDDKLVESVGLINVDYSKELLSRYFRGQDYLYNRLWTLIVLHKWWTRHA